MKRNMSPCTALFFFLVILSVKAENEKGVTKKNMNESNRHVGGANKLREENIPKNYQCFVKIKILQTGYRIKNADEASWSAYLRNGSGSGAALSGIKEPIERSEEYTIVSYALATELMPKKVLKERLRNQLLEMEEELKDPRISSLRKLLNATFQKKIDRPVTKNLYEEMKISVQIMSDKNHIRPSIAEALEASKCEELEVPGAINESMKKDYIFRAYNREQYLKFGTPSWGENMFASKTLLKNIRDLPRPVVSELNCYAVDLDGIEHIDPSFWFFRKSLEAPENLSRFVEKQDNARTTVRERKLEMSHINIKEGEKWTTSRDQTCGTLRAKLGNLKSVACHCNESPIVIEKWWEYFLIGNFTHP